MGLRLSNSSHIANTSSGFSPVAGIHGVATHHLSCTVYPPVQFQSRCRDSWGCDKASTWMNGNIPSFQSRCRDSWGCDAVCWYRFILQCSSFSPVAGIHGVATAERFSERNAFRPCFSPVAGIHGVATLRLMQLEPSGGGFQSRCRDSWGCDRSTA